jgi:hypothetical protein
LQVYPDAHVVQPVKPVPPHCPHWAVVHPLLPPLDDDDWAGGAAELFVEVTSVLEGLLADVVGAWLGDWVVVGLLPPPLLAPQVKRGGPGIT